MTTTFIDHIIQNKIISHSLFWVSFVLIFAVLASLNQGPISHHLINYLALLPAQMLATYTMVYFQAPQLLLKKKYLLFILSFIASAYFFSVLARLFVIYIAEPFIREDFEQESLMEVLSDPFYLFTVYFPIVYLVVFLLLALKTIKDRLDEKHQLEVLQKEKVNNELKFLKAQIHPHFLFNTLNNLYALTLAKSDAAPKVVIKLSEMLDYMLYQCNGPSIAIHKEIELIQNYIDLEKLRYGDRLDLTFDHQTDNTNTQVAPLILLPIVENAFKHGASGNPFDPKISIDLKVQNDQLNFKVANTKPPINSVEKNERNGIGNVNLKRQLELNYPEKYQLDIEDKKDSYLVNLKIDLK